MVLAAMSSIKTDQSVPGNRRPPQIANRQHSREAPENLPLQRLARRQPSYQRTLRNRHLAPTAYQTALVPCSDTSPHPIWRVLSANTRQTPGRASVDSIQSSLCNQQNTKEKPPLLGVSATIRLSPSHPLNPGVPNDPSPTFGHSATSEQTKSVTGSPLPQPLPLTSSSSKTLKLRVISESPRRVEYSLPAASQLSWHRRRTAKYAAGAHANSASGTITSVAFPARHGALSTRFTFIGDAEAEGL